MKDIILLGSTGSIGRNVLDVVKRNAGKFRVKALASGANADLLAAQAAEFKPEYAAIGQSSMLTKLKSAVPAGVKVLAGGSEIEKIAAEVPADIVFIAISGTAALKPLMAALNAGRTVALASKEPIVSAGMIVKRMIDRTGARIIPVDSEHSAVMQCLSGRKNSDVRTLYITGSGGSLRDRDPADFDSISLNDVLSHPKWNMGRKITVDSATLMNKGLEVIEARWLFDITPDKIKVVIHPEAQIHAMVEFLDGTITAGMFMPDMRFPILRALSYPDIISSDLPRVDFSVVNSFTFSQPDTRKFPALGLAYEALEAGGTVPAVLNGANETAVGLFLNGKIKFTGITGLARKVMENHIKIDNPSLEDIIECHRWAHEEVLKSC